MITPSIQALASRLEYNPDTGSISWRDRPSVDFASPTVAKMWRRRFAGRRAGSINANGYVVVEVVIDPERRTVLQGHRLAWALHHGEWPRVEIDHINGIRADNRMANMRDITGAENQRNRKMPVGNASGVTGVSWHKSSGKWIACIRCDGRQKHLGTYRDITEAIAARRAAEIQLGYSPRHGTAA